MRWAPARVSGPGAGTPRIHSNRPGEDWSVTIAPLNEAMLFGASNAKHKFTTPDISDGMVYKQPVHMCTQCTAQNKRILDAPLRLEMQ